MAPRSKRPKINTKEIWGVAVGVDKDGIEQHISIYPTNEGGFIMHPSRGRAVAGHGGRLTERNVMAEVATVFGLMNLRVVDPKLEARIKSAR